MELADIAHLAVLLVLELMIHVLHAKLVKFYITVHAMISALIL